MQGFPNHHLLKEGGAVLLGEYESEEKLFMVGLKSRAYPYVIDEAVHPSCQATTIKGEVYEVSYDLIQRLDAFEGHPYHYTRQTLIVHAGNRFQPVIAYTYIVINEFLKAEIEAAFEERQQSWHSAPGRSPGEERFIIVPDGNWKNLIAASAAEDK